MTSKMWKGLQYRLNNDRMKNRMRQFYAFKDSYSHEMVVLDRLRLSKKALKLSINNTLCAFL